MLPLICNNTWQGRINGSLATYVPAARLTGDRLYILRVTLHYLHSPPVMGTFFFPSKGNHWLQPRQRWRACHPSQRSLPVRQNTKNNTAAEPKKNKTVLSDMHSSESLESLQEHLQPCANEALFPPLLLISATNRFMFVNSLWVTAQVDDPPLRKSIVLF